MRCLVPGSWVSPSTRMTSAKPSPPWRGSEPACATNSWSRIQSGRWPPMPSPEAPPASSLDLPERVEIEAQAETPAYLVLADTFDPGWSATIDGVSAPIRPAYVAFRAVYLTPGMHKIIFTYRPAGLDLGLSLTGCGLLLALLLLFRPQSSLVLCACALCVELAATLRTWWFLALAGIVLASIVSVGPDGRLGLHTRWKNGFHRHTWGAGVAAMKANRM